MLTDIPTVWERMADAAQGTAMSPSELADRFGVELDQVEEELERLGLVLCAGCAWWAEVGDVDEDGVCDDC